MQTTLILEERDREMLSRVLTNYLGDLRMTIRDTENYSMREEMHRDEDAIKAILETLKAESTPAQG